MNKFLAILVLGLLLSANGSLSEEKYSLFGITIGDDVNKYNPKAGIIEKRLIIDPPKPNENFILYWASINKKTKEIVHVGAFHKEFYPFGFEKGQEGITDEQLDMATIISKKCRLDTKVFVELIVTGDQFKNFNNNFNDYDSSSISPVYIFDGNKIDYGENGNIKFSVGASCSRPIKLYKNESFGVRADITITDHRNLYQVIKDNEEYEKEQLDKSGLQ